MNNIITVAFEIVSYKLAGLRAVIEKLARRAQKLGVAGPSMTVGESFEKAFKVLEGERHVTRYAECYRVEIAGVVVSLSGWSFIASLDHDGEENVIRSAHGDAVPVEYRTVAPKCDHCKTARRRAETFVLRHEDGRHVQIGRSCLRDFLGHENPLHAAGQAEMLWEAIGAARGFDDGWEGGGVHGDPPIEEYLQWVACAVRLNGWVSRRAAEDRNSVSSSSAASTWISGLGRPTRKPEDEAKDRARAEAALEWARSLDGDLSDYEHNLRATAKRHSAPHKSRGIIASIIVAHDRELARRAPRPVSQHFGVVRTKEMKKYKRETFTLTVERVVVLESLDYGTSYLHIFRDAAGNVATWKTGTERLEERATYAVTATVVEHQWYEPKRRDGTEGDAIAQTKLSRCKAERVVESEAA